VYCILFHCLILHYNEVSDGMKGTRIPFILVTLFDITTTLRDLKQHFIFCTNELVWLNLGGISSTSFPTWRYWEPWLHPIDPNIVTHLKPQSDFTFGWVSIVKYCPIWPTHGLPFVLFFLHHSHNFFINNRASTQYLRERQSICTYKF
jgi:hypothetical protein